MEDISKMNYVAPEVVDASAVSETNLFPEDENMTPLEKLMNLYEKQYFAEHGFIMTGQQRRALRKRLVKQYGKKLNYIKFD